MRLFIAAVILLGSVSADAQAAASKEHRSETVKERFQRLHPCPSTGLKRGACPGYVKDHINPLCNGGPDAVTNMQWQTVKTAARKDRWEWRLCHHKLRWWERWDWEIF